MYKKTLINIFILILVSSTVFTQGSIFKIDSVSVNLNTNKTIISWLPRLDTSDIDSVRIGYKEEYNQPAIDRVGLALLPISFFIDLDTLNERNPSEKSQVYAVTDQETGAPYCTPHKTIFLETELDTCLGQVDLSWSNYLNWDGDVSYYKIYFN